MKKILLLAPDFYEYTSSIREEMRLHGCDTDFYDTRPPVSSIQKARMKKSPSYQYKMLEAYKTRILSEIQGVHYDLVLVIACVTFDRKQLSEILDAAGNCKKIFYMWDSFCNYPKTAEILSLFDANYSFDPLDCEAYNMIYRPTFYSKSCLRYKEDLHPEKRQDIFFIASFLPERYRILKGFVADMSAKNVNFKFHLYAKSYGAYLYFKLNNRHLALSRKDFTLAVMDEKTKVENILASTAILDIPFCEQAGLTMRVLEGIVLGKKIITTNQSIKKYPFYSSNNIAVITETDFSEVTRDFLDGEILPYDDIYKEDFSVQSFVKALILDHL